MSEIYWIYISVVVLSSVKFLGGPITGIAAGLGIVETSLLTALGAFLMVCLITFVGDTYRKTITIFLTKIKVKFYFALLFIIKKLNLLKPDKIISFEQWIEKSKSPNIFSKRIKTSIKIYRKFGIIGIAFLTPLLFSPPVGAIIAVSFNVAPRKILFYMAISFLLIAFPTTLVIVQCADILEQWFGFKL